MARKNNGVKKVVSTFKVRTPRTKRFRQAQVIKQVGATPVRTRRGTVFQLGGGVFSKRQILASRRRHVRVRAPKIARRVKKEEFGL